MRDSPRAPGALFVVWLALYVLCANGRICPGDEETMFRVTEALATRGAVDVGHEEVVAVRPVPEVPGLLPRRPTKLSAAIQPFFAEAGVDGRLYSKYGIGQSLAALPFWPLGLALDWAIPGLGTAYAVRFSASFLGALMTALAAWLVADTGMALGYRLRTSLALSAAYGLATMAWPAGKAWFSEPAVTALVLFAFDAGLRGRDTGKRREAWLCGAALMAALLFRVTTLIVLPAFLLLVLWPGAPNRRLRIYALLIPAFLAVTLTGLYNNARFGSPLSFGYHDAEWDSSFVGGIVGLLASPGKGLFLYCPPLVLGLGGLLLWLSGSAKWRAAGVTVLALTLCTLAFIAPYHFWTGGWNWGPRFLALLVPFLLLPAGAMLEAPGRGVRTAWVALFILGLGINLPAVLVDHSRHLVSEAEADVGDDAAGFYNRTIWDAAHSPVVRQWPMVQEVWALWNNQRDGLAREARSFPADPPGINAREEYLRWNALDFWQIHWWLLGFPMWFPLLVSATCLAAAGWALCRLCNLGNCAATSCRT
jgi:hypothetical protein